MRTTYRIANAPAYVLSLKRSKERLEEMRRRFPEAFITIEAIDGLEWGTFMPTKRVDPKFTEGWGKGEMEGWSEWVMSRWDESHRTRLIREGVLGEGHFPMLPGEVACAVSHAKMWKEFLGGTSSWGIFLEDDAYPKYSSPQTLREVIVQGLRNEEADMVVFPHEEKAVRFGPGKEVLWCRGTVGYALTRKAAEVLIHATFPLYLPLDVQMYWRTIPGYPVYETFIDYKVPYFAPMTKLKVLGLLGVIEESPVTGPDSTIVMNGWV